MRPKVAAALVEAAEQHMSGATTSPKTRKND